MLGKVAASETSSFDARVWLDGQASGPVYEQEQDAADSISVQHAVCLLTGSGWRSCSACHVSVGRAVPGDAMQRPAISKVDRTARARTKLLPLSAGEVEQADEPQQRETA